MNNDVLIKLIYFIVLKVLEPVQAVFSIYEGYIPKKLNKQTQKNNYSTYCIFQLTALFFSKQHVDIPSPKMPGWFISPGFCPKSFSAFSHIDSQSRKFLIVNSTHKIQNVASSTPCGFDVFGSVFKSVLLSTIIGSATEQNPLGPIKSHKNFNNRSILRTVQV